MMEHKRNKGRISHRRLSHHQVTARSLNQLMRLHHRHRSQTGMKSREFYSVKRDEEKCITKSRGNKKERSQNGFMATM